MGKNYWDQHDKSLDDIFNKGVPAFQDPGTKQVQKFSKHIGEVQSKVLGFMRATTKEAIKDLKELIGLEKKLSETVGKRTKTKRPRTTDPESIPGMPVIPGIGGRRGGGSRGGSDFDIKGITKIAGPLTSAVKEIGGALARAMPAIVMFGSIAGIIGGVISKIFGLQDATSDFLRSLGGDEHKIEMFKQSLVGMTAETRLSQEEILDLSRAFLAAGVPVSKLSDGMDQFVYASADAIRMFGLTTTEAAKTTRTLQMQGLSWSQIKSHWEDITSGMQEFNLTVQDGNAAIVDGQSAWEEYGATLGASVQDFQHAALKARGMFKAMNMDATKASSSLNKIYGASVGQKMQLSAFMSAAGGGDAMKLYNQQFNPAKAEEAMGNQMKYGIALMQQMMGDNGQYLKMDQGALDKKFSGNQQKLFSINTGRSNAMDVLKSMGFDDEMVQGALRQYQNYGGNLDSFVPDMTKIQKVNSPEASMATSLESLNNTLPELLKKLNNKLDAIFTQLANKISPHLPKIIESMDRAVDSIYAVTNAIIAVNGGIKDAFKWCQNVLFKFMVDTFKAISDPGGMLGKVLQPILPGIAGNDTLNNVMNIIGKGMGVLTGGKSSNPGSLPGAVMAPIKSQLEKNGVMAPTSHGFMSTGNKAFDAKIAEVAKKHNMLPEHLKAVMMLETGGTLSPSKKNKKSSATGLIQFMASTAKGLGTTTGDLAQMSQVEQMDYVDKYMKNKHVRPGNLQDTYMSVFSPAYIGKGPDHPMYSANSKSAKNREAYARNIGLDLDKDGVMTTGEAARAVEKWLKRDQAALAKALAKNNALLAEQNEILKSTKEDKKKADQDMQKAMIARDPASMQYAQKVAGSGI